LTMAEAVKKPAGGAFGQWLNANRTNLAEQAKKDGLTGVTAVSKKAGEVWKTMSAADKAPWEKKFKEAQAAFNAYKSSDSYVAAEKKHKRGKGDDKPKKDKDAPKKPVGGGCGMFSNEKREDFTKACEAKGEKGFGPVAKMTGEAYKALSEAQKKPYEDKFKKAMEEYQVAIVAYKAKEAAEGAAADDDENEMALRMKAVQLKKIFAEFPELAHQVPPATNEDEVKVVAFRLYGAVDRGSSKVF